MERTVTRPALSRGCLYFCRGPVFEGLDGSQKSKLVCELFLIFHAQSSVVSLQWSHTQPV
jgi:hypothetical protein